MKVPVGTQIYEEDGETLNIDMDRPGMRYRLLKGGNGGFGNYHFKSATNQAPEFALPGLPAEERIFILKLKLIADAGLIGMPNAGKSTFLSRVSAARPKIADYPFTTLEPNLGVVQLADYKTFVVADIPGLIEGAHTGAGLGIQFLRHIERTRLLAHLVDVSEASGRDPVHDFEVVMQELASFSEELAAKPMILVATKMDAAQDPERVAALRRVGKTLGLPFFEISSATGQGIDALKFAMAERVLAPAA
jgi:GTP-binding protein